MRFGLICQIGIQTHRFSGIVFCFGQLSLKYGDFRFIVGKAFPDLSGQFFCRGDIPRSQTITDCEDEGMTVIEGAPDSEISAVYTKLAKAIMGVD